MKQNLSDYLTNVYNIKHKQKQIKFVRNTTKTFQSVLPSLSIISDISYILPVQFLPFPAESHAQVHVSYVNYANLHTHD